MKIKSGWRRVMPGMYFYTNAAGKDLALVERYRSFWNITVYVKGDAAQQVTLSASPKTLREAKEIAQRAYLSLTKSQVERDIVAARRAGIA